MSHWDNTFRWTGRDDKEDGEQGKRWHHVIRHVTLDIEDKSLHTANDSRHVVDDDRGNNSKSIGLVGFACDLGVHNNKGRIGAKQGPYALRHALANQAWHHTNGVIDFGTLVANDVSDTNTDDALSVAQLDYAQMISHSLNTTSFTIGLGGGHEIAYGSFLGLLNSHIAKPGERIGIVNIDAHFDLRKPAPLTSSGTPFRQIQDECNNNNIPLTYCCLGIAETANTPALFEYAEATNTRYLLDTECCFDNITRVLTECLTEIDVLYLTICMDAFPSYVAPGVSAPSALGVSPQLVIEIIHWLARQQKTLNFAWPLVDIAELNPNFDLDNRTAKLAARLLHEVVRARP